MKQLIQSKWEENNHKEHKTDKQKRKLTKPNIRFSEINKIN